MSGLGMSDERGWTNLEWQAGDPDGMCGVSLDLDPWSSTQGGLYVDCSRLAGHDGPHRRLIEWTQEHPDSTDHTTRPPRMLDQPPPNLT